MTKILAILSFFLAFNIAAGQTTIDTKAFGQDVLDRKINPTDDIKTFHTLDSLLCKNKSDKLFYFKVSNKIQQTSDGALSGHVSTTFSDYYFKQNSEFIENSKTLSESDVYKWLDYIAYDLYASNPNGEKGLLKIKERIKSVEKKHHIDTLNNAILLKKYNDYLYSKTEKLVKAG